MANRQSPEALHIGQNIAKLMERSPAVSTQMALARQSGVTQSTIGRILRGEVSPTAGVLKAIADALRVPVDALYQPARLPPPQGDEVPLTDNPSFPAIRRVKFKLSAGASGFGIQYLQEEDAPIVFRREWFESRGYSPHKLFAVTVANGSMEPGLWAGDTVVVNTAETTPRDGEVFAVNYEGELVIKRLIRDSGRWWLHSDNPDQNRYPRKACDDGVFLVGRIVHKQSEHV